jgi:pantetheine-phosphate adenylyltransferase
VITAVVAGSFDPITNGHVDIIRRGSALFDRVVVGCGHNVNKRYLCDLERRMELVRESTSALANVTVEPFEGLLVDFCQRLDAKVILRGLRATSDFDFEFQIGLANMDMAPRVETVFLLSPPENIFISSSLVKEIAVNGGDVSRYVPACVDAMLREALRAG